MSDLTKAIYDRLAGSAELTALLDTYAGDPAIFSGDDVPADAAGTYVWIPPAVTDNPWDTKNSEGREVFQDIHVYAPRTGSSATIDAIAEVIRALFHRYNLVIDSTRTVMIASASGPLIAPDLDELVTGRVISVRFIWTE